MQSIMGPMNLTDNPLVKKYLMGSRDRVYGEALEGCVLVLFCLLHADGMVLGCAFTNPRPPFLSPPGSHPFASSYPITTKPIIPRSPHREDDATVPLRAGAGAGAGRLEQEKKPESAAAKAERMEAVLDKVFNKEAPCAALLKACDKATINFVSAREGYSPLTVLCSRPDVTEQEVKQALYLGADKFHKDEDGCTALHWAAMKGVVAAAAVLTAAAGGSKALAEVEKLLKTKDGDGKTPMALAKESVEPDHEEVEALLVAVRGRFGLVGRVGVPWLGLARLGVVLVPCVLACVQVGVLTFPVYPSNHMQKQAKKKVEAALVMD